MGALLLLPPHPRQHQLCEHSVECVRNPAQSPPLVAFPSVATLFTSSIFLGHFLVPGDLAARFQVCFIRAIEQESRGKPLGVKVRQTVLQEAHRMETVHLLNGSDLHIHLGRLFFPPGPACGIDFPDMDDSAEQA